MKRLIPALTAAVLSVATPAVVHASEADTTRAQRIEETVKRLNLTEDQKGKVQSVLEETSRQREEILKRHGVDPEDPAAGLKKMRPREKMAMRKELQTVDGAMDDLKQILTAEQLATLKTIQAERSAKLREGLGAR